MAGRFWIAALAIVIGLCGPSRASEPLASDIKASSGAKDVDNDVFGLTKVHQFHLHVTAKDYSAMEPTSGGFPFGPGGQWRAGAGSGGGPNRPAGPPAFGPDAGAGNFGYEFDYVHADFQTPERTYKDVGLRYKGSGTYLVSSRLAKRSFKVDFDQYDSRQEFAGFKKLNLNSGPMDPTKVREVLAYTVFRAAGVPAARTAFAEVRLTVPGKYDGEYLGLYTVVEQVDKAFLKTHFKSAKGLLLKPEGIRGVPHLGDDVAAYKQPYNPKSEGDDKDWQRLVEFTRLVNKADVAQFRTEIGSYLDVDGFARFLAVNTLLTSFDGFIGLGHNYYLYLSPETNKFAFFPWDLDLAFGAFPMFGTPDQQMDLSVDHPHLGENKLIDRLLAMPEVKEAYRGHVRRLAETVFTPEALGKDIESTETAVKELIAKEKQATEARKETGGFGFGAGGMGPFGASPVSLRTFVEKRAASVKSQLDGKSKGYVPAMGGFGPPDPAAFSPGRQLTKPAMNVSDANKDGRLTKEEVLSAAETLFSKWDKDGNGTLDEKELESGINSLVPAPQFGPPPGGPNRGPGAANQR